MHYATQQSRQFTVRSTAMIQGVNVWSTAAQLQYRGRRRPAYAATIPRPPYESSFWASKEAYETSRSRECGRRARHACDALLGASHGVSSARPATINHRHFTPAAAASHTPHAIVNLLLPLLLYRVTSRPPDISPLSNSIVYPSDSESSSKWHAWFAIVVRSGASLLGRRLPSRVQQHSALSAVS